MSRHHLASILAATVLLLALCACSKAALVDDAEAGVTFTTTTTDGSCSLAANDASCASKWWVEEGSTFNGGSSHVTFGPSASLSYSFKGATVHLIGSIFPQGRGAKALVTVDNGTANILDASSSAGATQRVDGIRLFTQSGLDRAVTHTITVAYDSASFNASAAHQFLAIDAIQVDDGSLAALVPSESAATLPNIASSTGTTTTVSSSSVSTETDNLSSTSTPTSPPRSLNTGRIAAIAASSVVLSLVLALAVMYCLRTQRSQKPRALKQYSKPRGSVLASMEKSHPNGSNIALVTPVYATPDLEASTPNGVIQTMFMLPTPPLDRSATFSTFRRDSPEPRPVINRQPSQNLFSPADSLSPNSSLPPDSGLDSASPSSAAPLLRHPRRVPAPLPLLHSNMNASTSGRADGDGNDAIIDPNSLHPHAVPTPRGSPRVADWMHVVIPPTPPANPPPAYTPRSGRPRNLAELREKMSPSAWSPSPLSSARD